MFSGAPNFNLKLNTRHSLGLWPGPGRRQLWILASQNVLRFFCGLSEAAEDSRCISKSTLIIP